MERARIIVKGEVQKVGFRGFVIEQMKSLRLNGYADNLPDGTVEILCEGEKDRIEELITQVRETPPHFAQVELAEPEWQEYVGDLKEPERRGDDIPKKEATLGDVVNVLKSFDQKAEILNERVGDVASNTEIIVSNTRTMASNTEDMATTLMAFRGESGNNQKQMLQKQDQMLEKQDQMLEKQDQMLEKQDTTIQRIDNMDTNLSQRIDNMDTNLSQRIDNMNANVTNRIETLNNNVTGRFDNLDTKYGEMTGTMKLINQNLEKLIKAILTLLEKKS